MANSKLSALAISSPRGTPDRANDVIYVEKAGVSYGSTVNNELGISGNPVGDTDSQTLTNKTLTSPAISGPTLSGTLTGTYTLAGTPTFPASVVTLTGSQTLTNKVLTSPTISAPTITNASITADAITGFTSANNGTIYGVGVTAGAISGTSLTDNTVPGVKLASYRIPYQTDNSNAIANTTGTTVKIQAGWGQVAGDGVNAFINDTVTFPAAFTTVLGISVSLLPVKGTPAATDITGLTTDYTSVMASASVKSTISTTGFGVVLMRASGTFSATSFYGYSWIAWGL